MNGRSARHSPGARNLAAKRHQGFLDGYSFPKMSKTICVLTYAEAEDFKLRQIIPNCANHYHVSKSEAAEMVAHEQAEIVASRKLRVKRLLAIRGRSCKYGEFILSNSFLHEVMRMHQDLRISPPGEASPSAAPVLAD